MHRYSLLYVGLNFAAYPSRDRTGLPLYTTLQSIIIRTRQKKRQRDYHWAVFYRGHGMSGFFLNN